MRSSRKHVFYDDLSFEVSEDVYEPAEDTFLMIDTIGSVVKAGDIVLDIGTGCGILAVIAAKKASRVVATDVNPHAVECARLNAIKNSVAEKVEVRLGSLFQPVRKAENFDVVAFNAPYLPSAPEERKTWIGRTWYGGSTGRQLIDQFIKEAPHYLRRNGTIMLVQSNLAGVDQTLERFLGEGLEAKVIAETKVSFERIVIIQASNLFTQSA